MAGHSTTGAFIHYGNPSEKLCHNKSIFTIFETHPISVGQLGLPGNGFTAASLLKRPLSEETVNDTLRVTACSSSWSLTIRWKLQYI